MIKMGLVRTRDTTSHLVFFRLCRSSYTLGKHPCCEKCFWLLNVSKRKVRDWKTCLSLFICSEYVIVVRSGVSLWQFLGPFSALLRPSQNRLRIAACSSRPVPFIPLIPFIPSAHERHGHGPCPSACPCPDNAFLHVKRHGGIDVALWCLMMFDDVWWPICSKTFQDMISIDHKDTQMVEQFHSSHANSYSSSLAQWGKHRSSLAALRCPAMSGLPFALPFWPPLRFLALPWLWRRPK